MKNERDIHFRKIYLSFRYIVEFVVCDSNWYMKNEEDMHFTRYILCFMHIIGFFVCDSNA